MTKAIMNILFLPILSVTMVKGILTTTMRTDWMERMRPSWRREAPISRT